MSCYIGKIKDVRLFLLWMIISFIYGAGIFLTGFFPINNYSMEHTEDGSRPHKLDNMSLSPPAQLYEQTILMIVDALRMDFPTQNRMPFSYNNSCSRLELRVNIPTVTMPRLKSLTTGTISNFIDIVLNIGHVEQLSDSLLHRLYKRNENMVFAGDRTWISLFPKQFKRFTSNTDSFFVNDFYEGDKNVTTVLTKELLNSDWMLLVLHYLGLDHIGHVEGSESSKIPLKLKEMDEVVQKIYEKQMFHKQLLLLTGDHGMRDGGGHGGSTTAEMYVPLYVFKENCSSKSFSKTNEYNQIDLAPTLAVLWTMEVPPMSIGCLIPQLLDEFSLEDQLYAFYYNALHLLQKARKKFGQAHVDGSAFIVWFTTAKNAHKRFLSTKRNDNFENTFIFEDAKVHYLRMSREISQQLSASLVQFDYGLITLGLLLTTLVASKTLLVICISAECVFIQGTGSYLSLLAFAACINKWCHYQHYFVTNSFTATLALVLALMTSIYLLIDITVILLRRLHSCNGLKISLPKQSWFLLGCLLFHTLSLTSSSFIENENKTWHYLGASALILLCAIQFFTELRSHNLKTVVSDVNFYKAAMSQLLKMHTTLIVIGCLGVWVRLDDAAFYINQRKNKTWLSFMFSIALLLYTLCLCQHKLVRTRKELVLYVLAALLIYGYRGIKGQVYFILDTKSCDIILNIFWLVVTIATCLSAVILCSKHRINYQLYIVLAGCFRILLTLVLTISMLLHKPHNALLVANLIYTLSMSYKFCNKLEWNMSLYSYKYLSKLLCSILIANMFYFYQGNSNSFATIDLNPGYIGQTTYNPVIVGVLVTLNMYSAQFISFLYLITHILEDYDNNKTNELAAHEHIHFILYFYTLSIFVPVLIYLWLLLFFRYHLFIYSVFAPKALYEFYKVFVLLLTYVMTTINLYIFGV